MNDERHTSRFETRAFQFRTLCGGRGGQLAAHDVRKIDPGLLKDGALAQYTRFAATAFRSLPAVVTECRAAVGLLQGVGDPVVKLAQVRNDDGSGTWPLLIPTSSGRFLRGRLLLRSGLLPGRCLLLHGLLWLAATSVSAACAAVLPVVFAAVLRPHRFVPRSGATARIAWHSSRVSVFGSRSFGILPFFTVGDVGAVAAVQHLDAVSRKSRMSRLASDLCFSLISSSARRA